MAVTLPGESHFPPPEAAAKEGREFILRLDPVVESWHAQRPKGWRGTEPYMEERFTGIVHVQLMDVSRVYLLRGTVASKDAPALIAAAMQAQMMLAHGLLG